MKFILLSVVLANRVLSHDISDNLSDEMIALSLAFEEYSLTDLNASETPIYMIDQQDIQTYLSISDQIKKVFTFNGNVHTGDTFVPAQIPKILAISAKLISKFSNDKQELSTKNLNQLKENLLSMVDQHSDLFSEYKYENKGKTVNEIKGIINSQFIKSSGEVGNYASGQGAKVWASTIALASHLLKSSEFDDFSKATIVHLLVDQTIEGMTTQGGCIQGFVNRGFIALMSLLAYYLP